MGSSSAVWGAVDAVAVTPSDSTVLQPFRGLMVAGAGDVAIRTAKGNVVTMPGLVVGTVYPFQGDKVMDTNTNATGIVVLL